MASTKIINVQKGDSFDEVFSSFKTADAEEVIFILPKNSLFSKNEKHLELVKNEAEVTGKKVCLMTTDPVAIRLAGVYGLEVLAGAQPKPRSQAPIAKDEKRVKVPVIEDLTPDKESEIDDSEDTLVGTEEEEEESVFSESDDIVADNAIPGIQATLTSTKRNTPRASAKIETSDIRGRIMKDIIGDEPERNLEIEDPDENEFDIDIKRNTKLDERRESDIEQVWSNFSRPNETPRDYSETKRNAIPKLAYYLVGGVMVVAAIIFYGSFAKATILLYPEKQEVNFQTKLSASNIVSSVNANNSQIPGQLFSAQDSETGTFDATGQKNVVQKASGKISIYNRTLKPQPLVATTRFESPEGLIFRIPATITVPPATKNGSETVFGSIESVVYADRAGSEYNIGPVRFTIPGFKDSPNYDQFFALSTKPMSGGVVGPAKVVTEEDFAKAQELLTKKVKEKLEKTINSQTSELKALNSLAVKIDAVETNVKAGEAAEKLTMTIKASIKTMAFREEDVKNVLKNYISKNNDAELDENGLVLNYLTPVMNSDGNSMEFSVSVTGYAFKYIDASKISNDIPGMNETAIRSYFSNVPGVNARVILAPFWNSKVPTDKANVKVEIIKE